MLLQVLKLFNLESPHQVAAELLNVYDQLKQAMLELFGGHSQFVLSLKEGFSRAFQGLDEVTGVRVSGWNHCLFLDLRYIVARAPKGQLSPPFTFDVLVTSLNSKLQAVTPRALCTSLYPTVL